MRKIQYCTDIDVSFAKDSNACICTKCIALLEEFFRFKQLCNANEQWLKVDGNGNHVASGGKSPVIGDLTSHNPLQDSFNSSCSMITIGTDDGNSDGLPNSDTLQTCKYSFTALQSEETISRIFFLKKTLAFPCKQDNI